MINKLRELRKSLFHLRNNVVIMDKETIEEFLVALQEDVALIMDDEKKEKYLYYVTVCDYEACWYDSVWDNEVDLIVAYNEYELREDNHEQLKQMGKRPINSSVGREMIGEY